jgi:hypothetical protein
MAAMARHCLTGLPIWRRDGSPAFAAAAGGRSRGAHRPRSLAFCHRLATQERQ